MFQGEIETNQMPPVEQDNVLSISDGERITAVYVKQDTTSGETTILTASASIFIDDFADSAMAAVSIPDLQADGVLGRIEVAGDTDWFQFDVAAGEGYEFLLELEDDLDSAAITLHRSESVTALGHAQASRGVSSDLEFFPLIAERIAIEVAGIGPNVGVYSPAIRRPMITRI